MHRSLNKTWCILKGERLNLMKTLFNPCDCIKNNSYANASEQAFVNRSFFYKIIIKQRMRF